MQCPICRFENQEGARICENCDTPLRPKKETEAEQAESIRVVIEELTPGSVFANRYQVIEEIGRGDMGRVYKVLDYKTNETIALKLINPEVASDSPLIERISNEFRRAGKIKHKNVCAMLEMAEVQGAHFVTMEYVAGENLKTMIQMIGNLSLSTIFSVGKQICEGLAEAHSMGIVHGDLKSQNIMIERGGKARIMDFGIPRMIKEKGSLSLNATIGTPAYMSPEQAGGEDIDHLSDLYSLGVILYEMATGRVPYEGDTPISIITKQKETVPRNPKKFNPNVSEALSDVILNCLEKDRSRRYQNAIEVREELEKIEKAPAAAEPAAAEKELRAAREVKARFNVRKILVPGLISLAVLILAAVIWRILPGRGTVPAQPGKPSVAVLPFEDLSPARDQEYLGKGIPDMVGRALSNVKELRVPSWASTDFFEGKNLGSGEIGQELGVEHILGASVQVQGDQLQIAAKLTRVKDGSQVWADKYNRKMENIFAVQDDIAQKVLRALKIKPSAEEKEEMAKRPADNLKAYLLYLQGRMMRGKGGRENLLKAIELFEASDQEDSGNALALAGIAEASLTLARGGFMPSKDCSTKALTCSVKALQLDETLVEAHCSMAGVRFFFEYNWLAAEMELQRAMELNSAYAPAHAAFALLLTSKGRFDQAIKESEQAGSLDPLSAEIQTNIGLMYLNARRYDQAIKKLKETTERFPEAEDAFFELGLAYLLKSSLDQALEIFHKIDAPSGVGMVYAKMGKRAEAQKMIEALLETSKSEPVSAYSIARSYFSIGEIDQGFNWLYRAYAERGPDVHLMKVDPLLDSARSDPRYNDLLRKMNLDL